MLVITTTIITVIAIAVFAHHLLKPRRGGRTTGVWYEEMGEHV